MRCSGAPAAARRSRARGPPSRAPRSTPTAARRRCPTRRARARKRSPTPTGLDLQTERGAPRTDRQRSARGRFEALLGHREVVALGLLQPGDRPLGRCLDVRIGAGAAADVLGDRLVLERPLVALDRLAVLVEPAEPLELVAVEAGLVD